MGRASRVAGLVALTVAVAFLWAFPIVLFPHPQTNDAIELSNLEPPVVFVGLLGLIAVLVFRRRQATVLRVGLGVYLLGAAIDLVVGLIAFGNLSDDRFLPLLVLPVPIGLAGLVTLMVGLASGGLRRPDLLRGAIFGLTGAVVVGEWTLVRGARDWLLAPYGLDITLLIVAIGAALFLLAPGAPDVRSGEAAGYTSFGPRRTGDRRRSK